MTQIQKIELYATLLQMVWAIDIANRNLLTQAEIATTRDSVTRLLRVLRIK